jgi:uncharacterized membrane protein
LLVVGLDSHESAEKSMTTYQVLKFVHVVGAIAWVGSGLGLLLMFRRLLATGEYQGLRAVVVQSKSIGTMLFMPASLLTIASGITLVITQPGFGFTDLWILIGLVGIVASGAAEMGIADPAGKRFLALSSEHGPDSPGAVDAVRRALAGSTLDQVILLVVVWAMVFKPLL